MDLQAPLICFSLNYVSLFSNPENESKMSGEGISF